MKLSRIKKLIFLHLQHLPMKSRGWRPTLCKWGGVNIKCRRPDCNAFHEPEDRQL